MNLNTEADKLISALEIACPDLKTKRLAEVFLRDCLMYLLVNEKISVNSKLNG